MPANTRMMMPNNDEPTRAAHSEQPKRRRRQQKNLAIQASVQGTVTYARPAMLLVCLWLSQVIFIQQLALAAASEQTAAALTSQNVSQSAPLVASDSSSSKSTSTSKWTEGVSNKTLEQQSTDLSSMYLQIPIAEPVESGADSQQQQQRAHDDDAEHTAATKASTWTGPWPKKFQIGYIKQSDLHQVLMESLKNEPFIDTARSTAATSAQSKGTPASGSSASKSAPAVQPPSVSSVAGSLMANYEPKQQATASALKRQPAALERPALVPMRSLYGLGGHHQHHQAAAFREQQQQQQQQQLRKHFGLAGAKFAHQQQQVAPMFYHHNNQLQQPLNHVPRLQAGNFQQTPRVLPMSSSYLQQRQPQFQFAGAQFASFKNQPIYTMNFQQQQQQQLQQSQQPIEEQVQLIQLGGQRLQAPKSDYYSSSWRPVATGGGDETKEGANGGVAAQAPTALNDGFDDELGLLAGGGSKDAQQMNRHPVLSSYLGNEQKMSPARALKSNSATGALAGSKGNSGAQGTKGGSTRSSGSKGNEQMERRAIAQANATTTTTTSTSSPIAQTSEQPNFSSVATTDESTGSAGVDLASTTSASSAPPETTTEPESEVIDGVTTTEQSDQEATTTTSTMAPTTSTNSLDGSSGATAAGSESGSTVTPVESASSSSSSSEMGATQREETTPSSATSVAPVSSSSISATGVEVEGAKVGASNATESSKLLAGSVVDSTQPSDEQLQAAAVRASSEINKSSGSLSTRSQRLQRPAAKKARSSEQRQVAAVAATARKTASPVQSNNKLITKRPQSQGKAAKQAAQTAGTKSAQANQRSSGQQQQKGASEKRTTGSPSSAQKQKQKAGKAAPKSTRMASGGPASERLQQQPKQQQQQQFVSMSSAQAQSTAQTLASLLLARCLASTNCAHLLDVCSTKQAAVALSTGGAPAQEGASSSASSADLLRPSVAANDTAAWSVPVGLMSSSLMSLMQALQADKVLRMFPQWRDTIENIVDQDASTGYTLLMPSNEAIDRLPLGQIDALLMEPSEQMAQLIENHILDSAETIELISGQQLVSSNRSGRIVQAQAQLQSFVPAQRVQRSRFLRSAKGHSLQVNQHRDRMVTINGKRVVYANQLSPANGRIHVVDGLLADWPPASLGQQQQSGQQRALDIMETLKQCDKFDGFVTLAEGTGLTSILKQDGPLTVFVPSNEALRKIPDEELEVIKNNSTALREFLMYHIVNGSYFSQDLRDGQQLASILDMRPIQVGVRVDGCSRRLVEANTSPMRRPDIVAKNGVIHILDWYLTVRDNDWCDQIGSRLPSAANQASATPAASATTPAGSSAPVVASERLQELASSEHAEQAPILASSTTYTAARIMTNLPPNHKAAPVGSTDQMIATRNIEETSGQTKSEQSKSAAAAKKA